jgi:hypothetical protein
MKLNKMAIKRFKSKLHPMITALPKYKAGKNIDPY